MKNKKEPAFTVDLETMPLSLDTMTLRDYFAAKAMNGFISNPGVDLTFGEMPEHDNKRLAKVSYLIAEAMIERREK